MLDFGEARKTAESYLDTEVRPEVDEEVIIVEVAIRETQDAWIFPYNSRIYVETSEISHAMVGNGPIVVPKDGRAPWAPFAGIPLESQIHGYDKAKKVFEGE